jgi:hypothetical protein
MSKKTKLKTIKETETLINKNLYRICGLITIIVMAMMTIGFFSRGVFPSPKVGVFYFGVLIIYSFHKELLRWLGEKKVERQGEYFVYVWIALATTLYVVNFLSKDYFGYSPEGIALGPLREICFTTLEVFGIFIITRGSKLLKILLEK